MRGDDGIEILKDCKNSHSQRREAPRLKQKLKFHGQGWGTACWEHSVGMLETQQHGAVSSGDLTVTFVIPIAPISTFTPLPHEGCAALPTSQGAGLKPQPCLWIHLNPMTLLGGSLNSQQIDVKIVVLPQSISEKKKWDHLIHI